MVVVLVAKFFFDKRIKVHKSRQYIRKWNLLSKLVSIIPVHRSPDRITTLFNRTFHFGIYRLISPCWSGFDRAPICRTPKKLISPPHDIIIKTDNKFQNGMYCRSLSLSFLFNIPFRKCYRQYIPKGNLLLRLFGIFPVRNLSVSFLFNIPFRKCHILVVVQITHLFNRKFHFGIYRRISPCWSGSIGPLFVEPKIY